MSAHPGKLQTPSEVSRALVTGGTGALGPGLVRHLAHEGFAVRVIARHLPPPGTYPQGVELLMGDIGHRECMRKAVEGVKLVFHLAAQLHVPNPPPKLRTEYWRVNVEGTRTLVEACLEKGVQRLVYFSTISVYGPSGGSWADEDTPPRPDSLYAETKLAGEGVVLAAKDPYTGVPLGVVLRMAATYGPRMKGNYLWLLKALSRGWFVPVGDGKNRRTLVHEHDVVRAAVLAAQHLRAPGRIYNVSDGEIHLVRAIIASICAAIGRRPPRFFLPARPTRWLARACDGLAGLAGASLNLTTRVDKFVEDVAIRADRIKHELGFLPLCGLEEGWRRTISDWQAGLGSSDIAAR